MPASAIGNDCKCLKMDAVIVLKQIGMRSKQRLQEYIGTFDRRFMLLVDDALAISIGISKKDYPLCYIVQTLMNIL